MSFNPADTVTVDIPLLIRLFELCREDYKEDIQIHELTEQMIRLSGGGKTLTMDDYEEIQNIKNKPKDNQDIKDIVEMVNRLRGRA